jgi:arylsulfatase A-like enzyme
MPRRLYSAIIILLAGHLSSLSGQSTISFGTDGGQWHIASDWQGGVIPGPADTVVINNSRTANLTQDAAQPVNLMRVGNQNRVTGGHTHYGQLNIGANLTVNGQLQIASAANAAGTIYQTAGTLTVGGTLQVASTNSGTQADYRITGGAVRAAGTLLVGTQGQGLLQVSGPLPDVQAAGFEIGAGGTLQFTLTADGVAPLRTVGAFNNGLGARLIIERGDFPWHADAVVPLVEAASVLQAWPVEHITFVGFTDPEPRVQATATGLVLSARREDEPPPPPPGGGPNIVIFLADDLGWQDTKLNDVGANCPWETPNVERLAARGMNFPQAYSPAPTCTPTRVALLTGKHSVRTGVTHVSGGQPPIGRAADTHMDPFYPARMEVSEVTIANALRDYGYRTGHVGKWHVAVNHNAYPGPLDQGFSWSSRARGVTRGMSPDRLSEFATDAPGDPYRLDADGRPFDQTTEDALTFMELNKEYPFFLYLAHWMVHTPIQTRDRALLQYYCDKLGIPFPTDPKAITTPGQTNPYYGAMVDTLDWSLGKVLDYLMATDDPRNPGHKLIDNTYLVFSSDNGGAVRSGQEIITSNAPLSKGKTSAREGGIRVPFVIAGPGIAANAKSQELLNLLDLYPTILTLTGAPGDPDQNAQFDGVDLSSHLFGASPWIAQADGTRRDTLYWHYPHILELHSAIRKGDFKLLKNYATNDYNLFRLYHSDGRRADWEEANDLAGDPAYAAVRDDLAADLEAFLVSLGAAYPHQNPDYSQAATLPGFNRMPRFVVKGYEPRTGEAYALYETGSDKAPVERVYMLYTLNGGHPDEEWFQVEAQLDRTRRRASAVLPAGATHFLFNLVDRNNFLVSTDKMRYQETASPLVSSPVVSELSMRQTGVGPTLDYLVPRGFVLQRSPDLKAWSTVSDWTWAPNQPESRQLVPTSTKQFFRVYLPADGSL